MFFLTRDTILTLVLELVGECSPGRWDLITAVEAVSEYPPHQHSLRGCYAVLSQDEGVLALSVGVAKIPAHNTGPS